MTDQHTGAAEKTVVFACGDHRLRAQNSLIAEHYGHVAQSFAPYGGMALYLLSDAPAQGLEYVLYQLEIARHFNVSHVVEVFHGGEALCAAYGHLASKRGLATAGQADHETLLGLQREAARRAAVLLAERGLHYTSVLYYVESIDGGKDRGRLLDLTSLAPLGDTSAGDAASGTSAPKRQA